jgi:hypothetical protein
VIFPPAGHVLCDLKDLQTVVQLPLDKRKISNRAAPVFTVSYRFDEHPPTSAGTFCGSRRS